MQRIKIGFGPLLYIVYTANVSSLLGSPAPSVVYALDLQARVHCHAADEVASDGLMRFANRLFPNLSKTQFIWFGGRRQLGGVEDFSRNFF